MSISSGPPSAPPPPPEWVPAPPSPNELAGLESRLLVAAWLGGIWFVGFAALGLFLVRQSRFELAPRIFTCIVLFVIGAIGPLLALIARAKLRAAKERAAPSPFKKQPARLLRPRFIGLLVAGLLACFGLFAYDWFSTVVGFPSPETCADAQPLLRRGYALEDSTRGTGRDPAFTDAQLPQVDGMQLDRAGPRDLDAMLQLKEGREELWRRVLSDLDFQRGYAASWIDEDSRMWLEVYQLGSHEEALSLHSWTTEISCDYSNEAFDVPGVPGSLGLQVRWSGGYTNDQISFVRGDRRYVVAIGNGTDQPPDRGRLFETARALADQHLER